MVACFRTVQPFVFSFKNGFLEGGNIFLQLFNIGTTFPTMYSSLAAVLHKGAMFTTPCS